MSSIKKHGKGWRAQVKVGGKRESAVKPTRQEAALWAADRERELRRQAEGTLGEVKTLRDAMRRYALEVSPEHKGERWETIRLAMLEDDAALPVTLPLNKITPQHLTTWKVARLKKVGPGSVLREMSLLGSVLSYARRDWGWMQTAPMSDVRRPSQPRHRDRLITWGETRRMLRQLGWRPSGRPETLKQVTAATFLLALRTGMRAGELTGLEWGRVRQAWVELHDTKNGSSRDVPMPPKAMRLIERMRGLDEDRPLPIAVQTLDATFRRARDEAGLSGFRFHDSRHTAATRIGRTVGQPGRVSFPEFCLIMGWRDPKHALIYVNTSAADLATRLT
ncbi:MAG: site-specific integrase [Xenophilus sp.]